MAVSFYCLLLMVLMVRTLIAGIPFVQTYPDFLTNRIQFLSVVCGTNFKQVFSWNSLIAALIVPSNSAT